MNGHRYCYETAEGVYCNISCNDGFAFAIPPADVYFCAYDNMWTPTNKLPIPDCSGLHIWKQYNTIYEPLGSQECVNVMYMGHLFHCSPNGDQ